MITGWLNPGQSPTGLGSYRSKYGTASAMKGRSIDAMGTLGFSDHANYQRYAGLPATGAIDNPTINSLAARSVSPLAGATGPNGSSGPATSGSAVASTPNSAGGFYPHPSSILDTAPKAVMPTGGGIGPQGNAQQRWRSGQDDDGTGLKPLSDSRRFFWATGGIDARAPQANPQANKGAVQPVTFNNSSQVGNPVTFNNNVPGHSDWQPY